jgi:hypothetical protein
MRLVKFMMVLVVLSACGGNAASTTAAGGSVEEAKLPQPAAAWKRRNYRSGWQRGRDHYNGRC